MHDQETLFFGDQGAGPSDTQEELDDPANQEAAREIREATFGEAIGDLRREER